MDFRPIYQQHAIGSLERQAVDALELHCVHCRRVSALPIARAVALVGPAWPLSRLAYRAKCQGCGKVGAHVEPTNPPAPSTDDYVAWRERRLIWLRWEMEKLGG